MSAPNTVQLQRLTRTGAGVTRPPTDLGDDNVVYWEDQRRPRKFPVKAGLIAAFLLIVGVTFGCIGLVTLFKDSLSAATPFLVIGGITFIPGSFHVVILLCAYLGRPGYSYDQIPSIEE